MKAPTPVQLARPVAIEQAAILISQKRPIPYPVVLRAMRREYQRGAFHALCAVVVLGLVVALVRAWPW